MLLLNIIDDKCQNRFQIFMATFVTRDIKGEMTYMVLILKDEKKSGCLLSIVKVNVFKEIAY